MACFRQRELPAPRRMAGYREAAPTEAGRRVAAPWGCVGGASAVVRGPKTDRGSGGYCLGGVKDIV